MDVHLNTLSATLLAVNQRQAAAQSRSKRGLNATPFTDTILNREHKSVDKFIRDLKAFEATFFWYPPPPQSHPATQSHPGSSQYPSRTASASQPSSAQHNPKSQSGLDPQDADHLLAPRLPEPKQIQPPTPLRPTNQLKANSTSNSEPPQADTHSLLLAAQKLDDNYRSTPKTKKQIKALLKKHTDLARTIKSYETLVASNETRIRNLLSGKPPTDIPEPEEKPSAPIQKSATDPDTEELREELERIRENAQKEELEILALEELITDLDEDARQKQHRQHQQQQQQQRQRLQQEKAQLQQARAKGSAAAPKPPATPVKPPQVVEPPIGDEDLSTVGTEQDVSLAEQSVAGDDTVVLPSQEPHEDPAPSPPVSKIAQEQIGQDEETVKISQDETLSSQTTEAENDSAPETSEELERVTSNVWKLFGDGLRHVTPEKDGCDFVETLKLLNFLTAGGDRGTAGDTSLGSAHTFSTQTSQATEPSSAPISPFSPDTMMTAFVINKMLLTPAPHRLNIEELKSMGHQWWAAEGKQAYIKATRTEAEDDRPRSSEVSEDGQNLARKAIYGMVSKQLFIVKRQKGIGTIEFA